MRRLDCTEHTQNERETIKKTLNDNELATCDLDSIQKKKKEKTRRDYVRASFTVQTVCDSPFNESAVSAMNEEQCNLSVSNHSALISIY